MAKIRLTPEPTFKAKVGIPVPGVQLPTKVEFTFKHRDKDALQAWLAIEQTDDLVAVMDCAVAWENDEPFDDENVGRLLQSYVGAARAIVTTYLDELRGARAKN